MDLHALSRRELQALCKRNRIRANMTNAAMAEALQGLSSVDGIDELKETVWRGSWPWCQRSASERDGGADPGRAAEESEEGSLEGRGASGGGAAIRRACVHSKTNDEVGDVQDGNGFGAAESSDGTIGSAVEDVAVVMEEQRTKPQEEDETSEENDLTEVKEAAAHDTPQAELIDNEASEDNLDEDEEDDETSEDNLDEDEEDDEASEDNLDEGEEWTSNDDGAAEETDYDYTDGSDTEGIQEELNKPEEVRAKELQKQLFKDLHGVSLNKLRTTYKELLAAESAEGKMLPPAEVDYNACVIS
ncbi:hypothetical protein U9M48_025937 [Paspalum notatum var. saurae]|uniref:Uncharacterized protein n=1 Tax=Paspalum notatum var. saurae TaxID=547442 RepID=A0AAQ3WYH7_PASNO